MTTKRTLPLLAAVLFLLVLAAAACGSSEERVDTGADDAPASDEPDADTTDDTTRPGLAGIWILDSFVLDGASVDLPARPIDMEIAAGRIDGTGGCNGFGGTLDAGDDGSLRITEMAWTEMACPDTMDFETRYLPALAEVNRWEASPAGITLSGDRATLTYSPGEPPADLPLETTAWLFDTIFSGDGVERAASTTDQSMPPVTAVIADGAVTLTSDDCGSVVLPLAYEPGGDGNLNLPDVESVDAPGCDDPASNMLVAVDGFRSATGYLIVESRLTIIGLPGELIGFRAAT